MPVVLDSWSNLCPLLHFQEALNSHTAQYSFNNNKKRQTAVKITPVKDLYKTFQILKISCLLLNVVTQLIISKSNICHENDKNIYLVMTIFSHLKRRKRCYHRLCFASQYLVKTLYSKITQDSFSPIFFSLVTWYICKAVRLICHSLHSISSPPPHPSSQSPPYFLVDF